MSVRVPKHALWLPLLLAVQATEASIPFPGTIVIDPPSMPAGPMPTCSSDNAVTIHTELPLNSIGEPLEQGGPYAYIPNTPAGTVTVVDTSNYSVAGTVTVGGAPYGVAVAPGGNRVYIGGGTSISVIDAATRAVTDTINLSATPAGMKLLDDGAYLLVALEAEHELALIDTRTTEEIGDRIELSVAPRDLVVSPDQTVAYVLSHGDAAIDVIDLTTLEETTVSLGLASTEEAVALAISKDGTRLYVAINDDDNARLAAIATNGLAVVPDALMFAGQEIADLAIDRDSGSLHVIPRSDEDCTLAREYNAVTLATLATRVLPAGIARAVAQGGGLHAIAPQGQALLRSLDGYEDPYYYAVAATGTGPAALGDFIGPALQPLAMPSSAPDFSGIAVGESGNRTLTVTNAGNHPLRIYESELGPWEGCLPNPGGGGCTTLTSDFSAFSIASSDCAPEAPIAPGDSCAIELQYAPTDPAVFYHGWLRLHTNSGIMPVSVLLGVGAGETAPSTETPITAAGEIVAGAGATGPAALLVLALAALRRRIKGV